MSVEIFTIVKNGEYILPTYIRHYQKAFPNCIINIFDNNSTDNSATICRNAGCVVQEISYSDVMTEFVKVEREHKNNIWKNSKADWIIVCDQDELVQLTQADLPLLKDIDVIQFKGYNMMDIGGLKEPEKFVWGFPSFPYDKCLMFRSTLSEINFSGGSHTCKPEPEPWYSKYEYNMLHYNRSWFTLADLCRKFPTGSIKTLKLIYSTEKANVIKVL